MNEKIARPLGTGKIELSEEKGVHLNNWNLVGCGHTMEDFLTAIFNAVIKRSNVNLKIVKGEEKEMKTFQWDMSPIQTISEKKLIAGNYGIVNVYFIDDKYENYRIELTRAKMTGDELLAAARVLTEIAEYLKEKN